MTSNTKTLLTPDRSHKFIIVSHMEDFYLKKGYLPFSKKNIIQKSLLKFNLYFFRKIKIFLKLIFNCKFILSNPEKKDIVVFDCFTSMYIKRVLPNDNYKALSTRIERIKTIYFSKEIFFYIILNFFKRALKQNYLAALINVISPKVVITNIDNSIDFYMAAKIFKGKIKFIAVQNADRGEMRWISEEETKKVFIPEFLCFSDYEEQIYRNKKFNIGKFESVGSLRASLSKEYVKSEKININPEQYDICLISEPHPVLNSDYSQVKNFAESSGKVAEYTHCLCKKKKLNLIFVGKRDTEIEFYKEYLKEYDYKIFQSPRNEKEIYNTYLNVMRSKLVIGQISTVLREAISFRKKVLSCNFSGHPDMIFPGKGICSLDNVPYNLFEERVLQILSMTEKEYFDGLTVEKDFIMKSTTDTAMIIRNKLKDFLGHNS